jgi:hypothetical protein
MDNLVGVRKLIEAPDLEALGSMLDAGLRDYVDGGSPADGRLLAERCAFEHEVSGDAYQMRFPKAPSTRVTSLTRTRLPRARSPA